VTAHRARFVAAAVLALLIGGSLDACRRQRESYSPPAGVTWASNPIAGAFDVAELKRQTISSDRSGQYVQFDDMRFRVNEVQPWGYVGHQWPNGVLAYDFTADVRADATKVDQFIGACNLLTAGSGVACIDRGKFNPPGKEHYVLVENAACSLPTDPCNYSYVGRVGGVQMLGVVNWDNRIIIAHELKHALGWTHEHQRPDRDKYVRILTQNVASGKEHNFSIMVGAFTGHPYDFDSIMQYPPRAFSSNGNKTIEPLPPYASEEPKMGQRDHISVIDLAEVQGIYGAEGTEWCGLMRQPRNPPPAGCFFECSRAADPRFGRWMLCGSCRGAELCP
jgi:hypothetical protein